LWLTQIAALLLVQIARQSAAKVPKLAASLRVLCDIYVFNTKDSQFSEACTKFRHSYGGRH
jgi:hypothetical protein